MKKDITKRADIKLIITKFYARLLADETMLPFFEEIVRENHLEEHLESITDFWEDILLDTRNYKNNVLQKHLNFHEKIAFKKEHFTSWLHHLQHAIDTFYEGETTQRMKDRANSVAMVMQVKLHLYK